MTSLRATGDLHELPPAHYVWGGTLHAHYGHFLLDTLPRLWPFRSKCGQGLKVVFTEPGESLEHIFTLSFFLEIMRVLGITPADIVLLSRPTRIREILIPETMVVIQHCASIEFGQFCMELGDAIATSVRSSKSGLVYLTKSNLRTGIGRIVNEDEFAARLGDAGVQVVAPEALSFPDQIQLWRAAHKIGAYLGSQTHTGLFARNVDLVTLNHEPQLLSNQLIVDSLSGNQVAYVHPVGIDALGGDTSYRLNYRMRDVIGVADDFLRLLERGGRIAADRLRSRSAVDPCAHLDEPLGYLLSLGRRATQSSTFLPHSHHADPAQDAGRAVNGVLPPRYAFHTANEESPWWQVDLERTCTIHEVRVFNRMDIGRDHAASMDIWTSEDAQTWTSHLGDVDRTMSTVDDHPFRWQPPCEVLARYVRLVLRRGGYLHLRQVEVFGHDPH